MEDISPQHSVSQEILNYLKSQENVGEYSLEDLLEIERQLNKEEMQQILSELIGRIEERARMKEEHEEKLKAHNQYPLFNFSEIIEDFYIGKYYYIQKNSKNKDLRFRKYCELERKQFRICRHLQ